MKNKILLLAIMINTLMWATTEIKGGAAIYDYRGKTDNQYGRFQVIEVKNFDLNSGFSLLMNRDDMRYTYVDSYNLIRTAVSRSEELILGYSRKFDLESGMEIKAKSAWMKNNPYEYSLGGFLKYFNKKGDFNYSTAFGYGRSEAKRTNTVVITHAYAESFQANIGLDYRRKYGGLENNLAVFIRKNSKINDDDLRNFYTSTLYGLHDKFVGYFSFQTGDRYLMNSANFDFLNLNKDQLYYALAPGVKFLGDKSQWTALYEFKFSVFKDYEIQQHYLSLSRSW
jgi:hypothetical protein